jgi:hypothetical protein
LLVTMKVFQSPCASRNQVLDEKKDRQFKLSNEGDYRKSITEEEYEYVRREFGYDLVPPSQYVPSQSAATDFDDDIATQPSHVVEEPQSEVSGSESDDDYVAEMAYHENPVPYEKPRARAPLPEQHYRKPKPVDERRSRKAPPVDKRVREVHAHDGLIIDRAPTAENYHSDNSGDDKSRRSRYDIDERSVAEEMHARPKSVLDSIRSDSSFDRRWRAPRTQDNRRQKAVMDDDYPEHDSRPSRRSASRPADVFHRDEVPDRRAHPSRITTPVPDIRTIAEEQRLWQERQNREYELYAEDRDDRFKQTEDRGATEDRRAPEDGRRRSGSRPYLEDARVHPDPRLEKKTERSKEKSKKSRGILERVVASVAGRGRDKPNGREVDSVVRRGRDKPDSRLPNSAPRDRVPVEADVDERYYSVVRRDQRKPREREQPRAPRSSPPFQLHPPSLLSDVSYKYDPGSRVPIQYDDYTRETRSRKPSYDERARSPSHPPSYYGSFEDEYERVRPPKTPRSPAPPVDRHTPTRSHSFADPAPPLRINPEYTKRQVPAPPKLYHSSRLPARSPRDEQDFRRSRSKQRIPPKKNSNRGAYIVTGKEHYY